jgi:hypothetical protein
VFSHFKQGHIAWDHNVTRGTNQTPVTLGKASAMVAAFDADYNVNSASSGSVAWGKDNPSHTDYIGLAAWQTYLNGAGLGTGKEANSRTDLDPQLADPANGDFTIGNATVISMGAGAEQDEDNDAALVALFNLYKVADP